MRLGNLKLIPYEIATFLAMSKTINSLLTIDTPDALDRTPTLSPQDLINDEYIAYTLVSEIDLSKINRNTFLVINIDSIRLSSGDDNTIFTGSIYIGTDKAHDLLNNGRVRLLELSDAIDAVLQDKKLSAAGTIQVTDIHTVVFSEYRRGYRIQFTCSDRAGRKAVL